jgi:DNA-binding protein H-NS
MKRTELASLSTDELWTLREEITATLAAKIAAERDVLERRLRLLTRGHGHASEAPRRRPYPTVFPKFRNPNEPSQTWAGRGRPPRWLTAQLELGKRIDDFRIDSVAA